MKDIGIDLDILRVRWLASLDKLVYGFLCTKYRAARPTKRDIQRGGVPFDVDEIYDAIGLPSYCEPRINDSENLDPIHNSLRVLLELGLITAKITRGGVFKRYIVNALPTDLDPTKRPPYSFRTLDFKKTLPELRAIVARHFRTGVIVHIDRTDDVEYAQEWFDKTYKETRTVSVTGGSTIEVPNTEVNDFNYCSMTLVSVGVILRKKVY